MKKLLFVTFFIIGAAHAAAGSSAAGKTGEYSGSREDCSVGVHDDDDATSKFITICNDASTGTAIMISDETGAVLCNLQSGKSSMVRLPLKPESVRAYSYNVGTHTWVSLEVKVLPGSQVIYDSPTLQIHSIGTITFARRKHPDRIGRVYAAHHESPEED